MVGVAPIGTLQSGCSVMSGAWAVRTIRGGSWSEIGLAGKVRSNVGLACLARRGLAVAAWLAISSTLGTLSAVTAAV